MALNRDTEIAKIRIVASYFHGRFRIWASYYASAFIALVILLATLFFGEKITWEFYTATGAFLLLIFGYLFASVKRDYDASLGKVQEMIDLVNKGELLAGLKELRKWKKEKEEFHKKPLLVILVVLFLLIAFVITGYTWGYTSGYTSGLNDGRTSVIEKIAHHESVLLSLSSNDIMTQIRQNFSEKLNYTELLAWESTRLTYTKEPIKNRTTNPVEILKRGIGKCGEFSIVYVSICLANDIPARLVTGAVVDHAWAEVNPLKDGRTWIHVEPTDSCVRIQKGEKSIYDSPATVNNPSLYKNKNFQMVLSFEVIEEGQVLIIDRTSFYKS